MILLLGVVLALGITGTAQARYLGSGSDSGSFPLVLGFSDTLNRPLSMTVVVDANPRAPLDASSDYSVNCSRNFTTSRTVEYPISSVGSYIAHPTVGKADECSLSAFISYRSFDQAGSLSVTFYGSSKPKPKRKHKHHH